MWYIKSPFLRTVSRPASVTVKAYHSTNGDKPFDGQIGFGTHSVRQYKFDGDGGGTCKWTLTDATLRDHPIEPSYSIYYTSSPCYCLGLQSIDSILFCVTQSTQQSLVQNY